MQQRQIGQSGIAVSAVGLGCNNFGLFGDRIDSRACIHAALDEGITFFDMASEHGQGQEEAAVGAALKGVRHKVVIATKFGQQELLSVDDRGVPVMSMDDSRRGTSRRWIMQSVEESLKRLETDYIDLYQAHVPPGEGEAEQMMRALDDLVTSGKVRAIGQASTEGGAADLAALLDISDDLGLASFVSVETQYNLLQQEAEEALLPLARARGLGIIPFFPLASGILTGKYRRGVPPPSGSRLDMLPHLTGLLDLHGDALEAVGDFADERGMAMADLAFAWLLGDPTVASVIAGATTPAQVRQNAQSGRTALDPAERAALTAIVRAAGKG